MRKAFLVVVPVLAFLAVTCQNHYSYRDRDAVWSTPPSSPDGVLISLAADTCTPVKVTFFSVTGESLAVLLDSTICEGTDLKAGPALDAAFSRPGDSAWLTADKRGGIFFLKVQSPDTTFSRKVMLFW